MLNFSRLLLPLVLAASSLTSAHAGASFAEPPTAPALVQTEVQELSQAELTQLRKELAKRRRIHLRELRSYANAGDFPINKVSNGPINVFIDDEGHVCAAANLIRLDGHGELVKQTAKDTNYIVLATVTEGPLMDWMLGSGFTIEEIAQIQEPYMPIGGLEPLPEPMPEPHFAAAPLSPSEERQRVRTVLRSVHKLLQANSQKSLHLAVQRLAARPDLARTVLASPIKRARG